MSQRSGYIIETRHIRLIVAFHVSSVIPGLAARRVEQSSQPCTTTLLTAQLTTISPYHSLHCTPTALLLPHHLGFDMLPKKFRVESNI